MNKMILPVIKQFQFTDFIVNLALRDLKNSDAIRRTRAGRGASISWIIGHLLAYRFRALAVLGHPHDNKYEEIYGAAPAGDGSAYPPIEILLQEWNAHTREFYPHLESIPDGKLLSAATAGQNPHGEKTVLDEITFFPWHESSHIGAIGLMRLEMGYPAISELVMNEMRAKRP